MASTATLLAIGLAEALANSGLLAGVLNMIMGPGSIGTDLVRSAGLGGVTFTDSPGIGPALDAEAALRGLQMQAENGRQGCRHGFPRRRP
ncbi:aldehyde dehydrogenase family protein [Arthrobacter ramosus]|uniref:Aldehyde dehydrogenase family protein n=1 Tax=Arthrobacter ramosus TaxID=1672 RepID=A0ABV5Y586_ARTRM